MREFDNDGLRLAEFQGKIFEESRDYFECSSPIFLRRFYHSKLLSNLDKNDSSLISFDIKESLDSINRQFGDSKYGQEKYNKNILFWMGYLYRYISYTRGVKTRFIMKTFPYKQLLDVYKAYHTQDIEWCIRNLLELNNLNEKYFDPNYRFKKAFFKL